MVSVEFAAALPAVLLVLLVVLSAVRVGVDQVRVADAARVAARAAARGDAIDHIAALVDSDAPPGARISVARSGDSVTVVVTAPVGGPAGWIVGSSTLRSTVTASLEQGVGG